MPSGMTKLEVFNATLDILKEPPAQSSAGGNGPVVAFLNRNYRQTVLVCLRKYPWNFAKKLVSLSADSEAPEHTWTYSYKPTPGWVRVLPIHRGGLLYGAPVKFAVVGNRIYTNEPPPLKVTLIMDKSANPGEWDPLFVQMVTSSLALLGANKFTSKNKFIELASQMLNSAQAEAEMIDSLEGTPEPVEAFDVLRVRGGDEFTPRTWR